MTRVMQKISKSRFKARALELFREVEATGRVLVVTDNGEPRVEIRRYVPPKGDPLAVLRGSVAYFEQPTENIEFGDWEA